MASLNYTLLNIGSPAPATPAAAATFQEKHPSKKKAVRLAPGYLKPTLSFKAKVAAARATRAGLAV